MKLFVTDYDETLFVNNMNFNINIKKLYELHKLGFIIVISTGRSYESIKKQTEKYNIYYDYLNCADGSVIYDQNDKLINFYDIDPVIINEIIKLKNKIKYEEIQISYPEKYENIYDSTKKIAGINIVIKKELINQDFINEFMNLKKIYPNYNFVNYDHGDYIYLCVKRKNVNKAQGIKFMQELLNIDKKNIYVIGDSDNDYDMIKNYNGVSIMTDNVNIKSVSKKQYRNAYEYINDIIKDSF